MTLVTWANLNIEQWSAACCAALERARCVPPARPEVSPAALKPAPPASPPAVAPPTQKATR